MEGYISEVRLFGPTWAPRAWHLCDGSLIPISQNSALFSLIGTIYGGDGVTTLGLPDLRGRTAVGHGQGPGLSRVTAGEKAGVEQVTLTTATMPSHNHTAAGTASVGNQPSPVGHIPAAEAAAAADVWSSEAPGASHMNANMIGHTGGTLPHENRQPFLGISYIICLYGLFPSRN